ncbi:putative membrane protein [Micromonospora sp. A200]|uniref:hypothetical protein n=1 Tax=Micromonospora sp. A200 TaxID=2940568 RepID=UPI0024734E9E|nr:hypothetical protein [Micromonospora sp. A200]MDH6464882.1 putative membrane protein [Micromonospora sp. A200]
MQAQPTSSRPWWTCLCVPGYLLAAHAVVVVVLALNSNWLSGLYMSIYVLPVFLGAAPVAWLTLAMTHRSPWFKPRLDAFLAAGLGLLVSSLLLGAAVLWPR